MTITVTKPDDLIRSISRNGCLGHAASWTAAANASPSDRMNLTGIHHLIAPDFFARNGQQNLAQGFNPGLVIRSAGALKMAPEGAPGANPNWRSTQHSNTLTLRVAGLEDEVDERKRTKVRMH